MSSATHESYERTEDLKGPSERSFGITFCVVFALFAGISLLRGGTWWPWLGGISLVFGAAGILFPQILSPLNRLWFKLGLLLHKVVTPIIMGILFYGLITPVGLLMRLSGKDPMRLKSDSTLTSYWIDREPIPSGGDHMKSMCKCSGNHMKNTCVSH